MNNSKILGTLFVLTTVLLNAFCLDHNFECGLSFEPINLSQSQSKIVGGTPATPHSWPSIVYVQYSYMFDIENNGVVEKTDSIASVCGGIIISPSVILTAAHCVASESDVLSYNYLGNTINIPVKPNKYNPTIASIMTVFPGTHSLSALTLQDGKAVTKVIRHEAYDADAIKNDIALLILENNMNFTREIQPACLPNQKSETYPGINIHAYMAGWGNLQTDGESPDQLQNVLVTIYDSSACNNKSIGFVINSAAQICVGNISGYQGACQGDSGGPLYIIENSKQIAVGVTSFTILGCAEPGISKPAVYSRISDYLDWIEENSSLPPNDDGFLKRILEWIIMIIKKIFGLIL